MVVASTSIGFPLRPSRLCGFFIASILWKKYAKVFSQLKNCLDIVTEFQ